MGIPFFILFVLSIAFLSLGITGWGGFISVEWPQQDSADAKSDTAAVTPLPKSSTKLLGNRPVLHRVSAVFSEPLFYGLFSLSRRTGKRQNHEKT